ncbi:sugar ABC transporter substrate-binding protein [Nonomuraea sp. NN258]|uniref:ABC transporter substrate-binding protein n=1 Tax=Nonomuraea antri TaxID=2730852 RepID=UPI001568659B|nr:sugar ABC transporter substrate-binding protein [Nonomuraea antri]NRQ32410.1 sugar ABC transporter substrate-binding protein [Nonomuraea antri]
MKNPPKAALAVLAFALLTGACSSAEGGKPADPNAKIQLTMSVWGGDVDTKTYNERLALVSKKFPNITVKLEQTPGSGDYDQKIQTALAGGKGPDIMQFAENVHVFSGRNQLAPLDDRIAKAKIDLSRRFGPQVAAAYQRDGKTWALPDRSGAMVLYYNKKLFDAAGLSYPTGSWTWTEFRDAAIKLTKRDGDKVTQYGMAAGNWWPWWMTFMVQNGGGLVGPDGKPTADSPANVEALKFYNDLVHVDKVAPSPTDYANLGKDMGPDPLFAQGKAAMVFTGYWGIGTFKEATDLKWDIAPMFQGKRKATAGFGSGLAVNAKSEHQDAAFQVIEFLTSEEGQQPIVANSQDAPANLAVLGSDAFMKSAPVNMGAFKESAANLYTPPGGKHWNEMQKIFDDALGPFFQNETDAQATLDRIQGELEPLLAAS